MKLLFARHGETDLNRQQRYQGSTDTHLNESGIAQAEALVRALDDHPLDALVSSPLKRALQTARIVAAQTGLAVATMSEFAERSLGIFEGNNRQELEQRYPDLWSQDANRQMYCAPRGGESLYELTARVDSGITRLRATYADKTVLLVSHAAVARAFWGLSHRPTNAQYFAYRLGNGEIEEYLFDE